MAKMKISCPGCGKQYSVPAASMGKMASCKACGNKFQLGKTPPKKPTQQPKELPSVASGGAPEAGDDGFWDEVSSESIPIEAPPAVDKPRNMAVVNAMASAERGLDDSTEPKVRWGFQWGKVFLGAAIAILAGGAAAMIIINTGRLRRGTATLVAAAMGGIFMMINGLMGEEGIW